MKGDNENFEMNQTYPIQSRQSDGSIIYYVPVTLAAPPPSSFPQLMATPWNSKIPPSVYLFGNDSSKNNVHTSSQERKNHRKNSCDGRINAKEKDLNLKLAEMSLNSTRPKKEFRSPSIEYLKELDSESEEIFNEIAPLKSGIDMRLQVHARLGKIMKELFKECEFCQFGSTANGFSLRNADMDLCLILKEQSKSVSDIIETISLQLLKDTRFKNVQPLPKARIPIVKLRDVETGIACDIGVNNLLAVYNTDLLRTYSMIDKRIVSVGLLVKYWAKRRNINEPYFGTLSSYCYILMVIHFFQVRPIPIVPNLQAVNYSESKTRFVDGFETYFFSNLDSLDSFFSGNKENKETIGNLLCEFFRYFAYDFDYKKSVISIRTGSTISKEQKAWTVENGTLRDKFWFCVEDPFETTHNLGRLVDRDSLYDIRGEFIRAFQLMCRGFSLKIICEEFL